MVDAPVVQTEASEPGEEPLLSVFELPAATAKKSPELEAAATALLSALLYAPPTARRAVALPTRPLVCTERCGA